jgi:hypothetical protein
LPTEVIEKIPVPAGTVNGPGTIAGAETTVAAGGSETVAGATYVGTVVAFVVVGVVAGVEVFAVVGAVVAFVVAVVAFVVTVVMTFVVVTVVVEDVVVPSGTGTVVPDSRAADPGVTAAATEIGKMMPPARAIMSRAATSRRAPRICERCIPIIGEIGS